MANIQAQDPQGQPEYVVITIVRGAVHRIEPERSDTQSAIEAATTNGIAGALNKLAEYGFRLLDGSTLSPLQAHGAVEGVLFMFRER